MQYHQYTFIHGIWNIKLCDYYRRTRFNKNEFKLISNKYLLCNYFNAMHFERNALQRTESNRDSILHRAKNVLEMLRCDMFIEMATRAPWTIDTVDRVFKHKIVEMCCRYFIEQN